MKKDNIKRLFYIYIILCFLISCGNRLTDANNNNHDGKVIVIEANEYYEVIMGSKVEKVKGSDITNAWSNYIRNKEVDYPQSRRYFNTSGDYCEDDFSKTKPRAELIGAAIKERDNITYLMGIYYNNKILGSGFSQYMLIYIDSKGYERGYYGGGADRNKEPDYSTVWTHYSEAVNPLGKLKSY